MRNNRTVIIFSNFKLILLYYWYSCTIICIRVLHLCAHVCVCACVSMCSCFCVCVSVCLKIEERHSSHLLRVTYTDQNGLMEIRSYTVASFQTFLIWMEEIYYYYRKVGCYWSSGITRCYSFMQFCRYIWATTISWKITHGEVDVDHVVEEKLVRFFSVIVRLFRKQRGALCEST